MRFGFSFARWRTAWRDAVARFPFVLLCGVIGSGCAIVAIHTRDNDADLGTTQRLGMTVALGLPLFFSLRLLRERSARLARVPLAWIGVALIVGWYFLQPAQPAKGPEIYFVRWLLLLAALHFCAAISGYARSGESLGFWQFNRHLFLRFCLATLYSGVLTVGFELALLSASQLFELHLDRAYADLFFLMAGCFHPAFFLAGVPRNFAELDRAADYPRGLKAFTQFALAPLVAVYTAILFAYALKIILARSWPHGWVALPVLVLSGVGIFAALLLHPLGARPEETWARWYARNFPRALAPLAILLLLSVRERISAYGVTEERYLGIVAGFWIIAWAVVFIVRRNSGIRWIPISLALICLLAAFGPWSAGSISKMSQLHRVRAILQGHDLWRDGHAQPATQPIEIAADDRDQLRSALTYLLQMHGDAAVRPLFPSGLQKASLPWRNASNLLEALHLPLASSDSPITLYRETSAGVPVVGARRLWPISTYNCDSWNPEEAGKISIGVELGVLKIALPNDKKPQPVGLPAALFAHEHTFTLPAAELTADFTAGTRHFQIIFSELVFNRSKEGPRINRCDFLLLEK